MGTRSPKPIWEREHDFLSDCCSDLDIEKGDNDGESDDADADGGDLDRGEGDKAEVGGGDEIPVLPLVEHDCPHQDVHHDDHDAQGHRDDHLVEHQDIKMFKLQNVTDS